MLSHGLIEFIPSCIVSLGIPQEVLKEKYVAIITLSGQVIKKGDLMFILRMYTVALQFNHSWLMMLKFLKPAKVRWEFVLIDRYRKMPNYF